MGIVSYAQNFEDVLLNRVFASVNYAFYLDIGAHHPVDDSVTKSFYDRGWDGINIEPGEIFAELAAARPRDINLNIAVYDHPGDIAFMQHPGRYAGLSYVQGDDQLAIAARTGQPSVAIRTVPCDTLANVIAAHASGRPIAFIKIDVEGAELAIIRSTNWRSIRPTVLVIEATKPRSNQLDNQGWEPILLQQGYVRAYFDGINCFYVPDERTDLLRHFEMPVNVLDGFQSYHVLAAQEQARANWARVEEMAATNLRHFEDEAACKEQLATAQAQQRTLQKRLDAVFAEQNTLYAALDRGYTDRLDHARSATADRDAKLAARQNEIEHLKSLLDQAARRDDLLRRDAGRLHRLIRELRFPGGPGVLRAILPLARLLRWLAGTPVPSSLPEETAIAALEPLSAMRSAASHAITRRSLRRRVMATAAAPFKSVARPIVRQVRTFLVASLAGDVAQIDHKPRLVLQHIDLAGARDVGILQRELQAITARAAAPPAAITDVTRLEAEIKQFGRMLESTLMTLALDCSPPAASRYDLVTARRGALPGDRAGSGGPREPDGANLHPHSPRIALIS